MDEGYMQQKTRFCTNCGAPIFEGQFFCQNCGCKLEMPQQSFGQPQAEEPQKTWGMPQAEMPQQSFGQPQVEEPQQSFWQSQPEMPQPEMPQAEEPQNIWGQPQVEAPQQNWQYDTNQQAYNYNPNNQQEQQFDYGQTYQQQVFYGGQQGMPDQGMPPVNGPMNYQQPPKAPMDPKKKKKRIILFSCLGAAFLALIAVGLFLLFYFSFTRIDASKIYEIKYEGVNGKGRATISVDMECEELKDIANDQNSVDAINKYYLIDSIYFYAEPSDNLSNGDTIKVTADYNEDKFKKNKIKLSNTTFEIKVEGLIDAEEYDLFKDIQLTYEGVSGYGTPEIDTSSCDEFCNRYVRYYLNDYPENLKNGDTVTVIAEVDEDNLNENGYKTDVFEKIYTVEGLKEPQVYDVFKDIKLIYEGLSPNLSVSVDSSACETEIRDNVYFYISDYTNKKNGDTVTVNADFSQDYMRNLGYEITETSKDFVIENQGEVVSELSPDGVKNIDSSLATLLDNWMKENGEGYIYETEIASSVGDGYILEKATNTITNRYFASMVGGDPYNSYAVINKCSYTATNKDKKDTLTKDLYILVTFSNVAKAADGSYTYVTPETYFYSDDINQLIDALNETGFSYSEVKVTQ